MARNAIVKYRQERIFCALVDAGFAIFAINHQGIDLASSERVANQEPSASRLRTIALHRRSFELTCGIILAYPKLKPLDDPSRDIWRQLIRASSSTTFNLEEADAASSDADFVAKMRIALREAKEASVAIRIIIRCRLASYEQIATLGGEANELASISRRS